jgi:hypothetical protein
MVENLRRRAFTTWTSLSFLLNLVSEPDRRADWAELRIVLELFPIGILSDRAAGFLF